MTQKEAEDFLWNNEPERAKRTYKEEMKKQFEKKLIEIVLQNAIDHQVISYWYYNGTYHFGKYDHKNKTEYEITIKNLEIKEHNLNEIQSKRN